MAFSTPDSTNVRDGEVGNRDVAPLESLRDISGEQDYVLRSSSYGQHLETLNQRLYLACLPPVEIIETNPYLHTEDILDMVNAGIVQFTVADQHVAELEQIRRELLERDEEYKAGAAPPAGPAAGLRTLSLTGAGI